MVTPLATSIAANSDVTRVVRNRAIGRAGTPGANGRIGCVRFSACTWLFSSYT
jgi:hypothetical protein